MSMVAPATQRSAWMPVSALAMIASLFAGCANTPAYEAPHVDAAPSTQVLKSQPRCDAAAREPELRRRRGAVALVDRVSQLRLPAQRATAARQAGAGALSRA